MQNAAQSFSPQEATKKTKPKIESLTLIKSDEGYDKNSFILFCQTFCPVFICVEKSCSCLSFASPFVPYDFTTSTGQVEYPIAFSATLPISSLRSPVRPWEPMTIISAFCSWASLLMAW